MIRKREIEKLNKILGKDVEDEEARLARIKSELAEKEADSKEHMHKDLFRVSQNKNQFFEAAKQMMNSNVLQNSAHDSHMISYKKFYERCQKQGILAMPMFSNAQN